MDIYICLYICIYKRHIDKVVFNELTVFLLFHRIEIICTLTYKYVCMYTVLSCL